MSDSKPPSPNSAASAILPRTHPETDSCAHAGSPDSLAQSQHLRSASSPSSSSRCTTQKVCSTRTPPSRSHRACSRTSAPTSPSTSPAVWNSRCNLGRCHSPSRPPFGSWSRPRGEASATTETTCQRHRSGSKSCAYPHYPTATPSLLNGTSALAPALKNACGRGRPQTTTAAPGPFGDPISTRPIA